MVNGVQTVFKYFTGSVTMASLFERLCIPSHRPPQPDLKPHRDEGINRFMLRR